MHALYIHCFIIVPDPYVLKKCQLSSSFSSFLSSALSLSSMTDFLSLLGLCTVCVLFYFQCWIIVIFIWKINDYFLFCCCCCWVFLGFSRCPLPLHSQTKLCSDIFMNPDHSFLPSFPQFFESGNIYWRSITALDVYVHIIASFALRREATLALSPLLSRLNSLREVK